MRYTIRQFNKKFPDDDACLIYMFEQAYGDMPACPKCGVMSPSYYCIRTRKCFECKDCGDQIHPLANTIEGFWGQLKRSIDGTYHCVSPKYLQSYVNEFVYRYNHRQNPVFPVLIAAAARRVR